jgi:hypothetical protein
MSNNPNLLDEIQAFLNQENTELDVEVVYELDCQICGGECRGHFYSDEVGYFLDVEDLASE